MSALVRLGTEYRYLGTYLLSVHKVPLLHCAPPAESAPATGDEPHNTKRAGFMLRPVGALPGEHGRDVAMLASSSGCQPEAGSRVFCPSRRLPASPRRGLRSESAAVVAGIAIAGPHLVRVVGARGRSDAHLAYGVRRAWTDIFPRRLPPGQSPLAACPRAEPARKLSGGRARKERAGKLAGRPGWNELDN